MVNVTIPQWQLAGYEVRSESVVLMLVISGACTICFT